MNELKINQLVKVVEGKAKGNKAGTIVKILSKPGRLADQDALTSTNEYASKLMNKVLVENITGNGRHLTLNNNKKVCYECINDLVPATEEEKIKRRTKQ